MATKDDSDTVPTWRRVADKRLLLGEVEPFGDTDADSVTDKLMLGRLR
ncbi:MAG: hypothetical protein R3286_02215 [Gammaproteobacteria bacterium]|nr:hypothetical protein [Gammaproteobacteria bacterium]